MPTSIAMDAIWLPVLLALAGLLVLAPGSLRRPRARGSDRWAKGPGTTVPACPPVASRAGTIDVAAEVRTVLSRVGPEAERVFAQITVAVQPGLTADAEPCAFRQLLADLVSAAVGRAPCGQVLLAAGLQGGRVQITVSDDGMVIGRHANESTLRGASPLTALQGGTLEIEMRPGEGTVATLRLAATDVMALPVPVATAALAGVATPA